jgi:hypothetical protein
MPKLRTCQVLERVFLVEALTRYDLASTCLRFQEHYESPHFRRRVFTLEQFMDWSAGQRGDFTYYRDWSGFNFPSWVLEPFRAGEFDPLLDKERGLLDLFDGETDPFYVIGVVGDGVHVNRATLEHELAHALYTICDAYRRDVRACLRGLDTSALERDLVSLGYCRQVLQDEVHAYVLTEKLRSNRDQLRFAPVRRRLKAIFREHGGAAALQRVVHRARRPG